MKLQDIFKPRKKSKEVVLRSKIRSKKNNTPNIEGPYSFRAHMQKGLSGDMINPISGSV